MTRIAYIPDRARRPICEVAGSDAPGRLVNRWPDGSAQEVASG
jgi:hypothetical protein